MVAPNLKHEDCYMAWSNWCQYAEEEYQNQDGQYKSFEKYMGMNIFRENQSVANEECVRKVSLLSGPHWRTIMKMIEVRRNE